jgi:hypothetical protein
MMSTPSTDPLRRYADVREAFDIARAAVFEMRSTLIQTELQMSLDQWRIAAPGAVAGPSLGAGTGARISTAKEEWPTWEQFRSALDAYYKVQQEYQRVEHELTPEDRKTLRLG